MTTGAKTTAGDHRWLARAAIALEVVLVLALAWVLWVAVAAQHQKLLASTGQGQPGVMAVEGLRPARGADIPVGTFTERDGRTTRDVAWQDRPAAPGDRLEGVRVGDRAWAPGVRFTAVDVLVLAAVVAVLAWRLLRLARAVRGRGGR